MFARAAQRFDVHILEDVVGIRRGKAHTGSDPTKLRQHANIGRRECGSAGIQRAGVLIQGVTRRIECRCFHDGLYV